MEQQLKKAEQDCERLNQELATLQQSIPVSKSVKSYVMVAIVAPSGNSWCFAVVVPARAVVPAVSCAIRAVARGLPLVAGCECVRRDYSHLRGCNHRLCASGGHRLVEYIEGRPEPFAADYKRDQNPYANSNPNPGCCTVM